MPPFPLNSSFLVSAPFRDGFVVVRRTGVNYSSAELQLGKVENDRFPVAFRSADGRWRSLPVTPSMTAPTLIRVGATIAVLGLRCVDQECLWGRMVGALLSDDMTRWEEVASGKTKHSIETGASPVDGWGDVGVVGTEGFLYTVDTKTRRLIAIPDPLAAYRERGPVYTCITGSRVSSVALLTADHILYRTGPVATLHLGGKYDWRVSKAAHSSAAYKTPQLLCGRGGPLFLSSEGIEIGYKVSEDRWFERRAEFGRMEKDQVKFFAADHASQPDGSLVVVANGYVFVRSPDGVWRQEEQHATMVIETGSGLLLWDARSGEWTYMRP